jgi:RNA polymerase sigma factor (sigma-70 family)
MKDSSEDRISGLFSEYGESMFRQARRILRSDADADDAVQEVILSLIRAPHVLASVERIGSWLFTLVRNKCSDIIRREKRVRATDSTDVFQNGEWPEDTLEQEEIIGAVSDAVGTLPGELKSVFIANVLEMKPFSEISQESGIPMGTLMSRKQKAVEIIRNRLRQKKILD